VMWPVSPTNRKNAGPLVPSLAFDDEIRCGVGGLFRSGPPPGIETTKRHGRLGTAVDATGVEGAGRPVPLSDTPQTDWRRGRTRPRH